MPLLRITCPAGRTESLVAILEPRAVGLSVLPSASRLSNSDLILLEVPRASIDEILDLLIDGDDGDGEMHVSVEATEQLYPRTEADDDDDEAVIWAQVAKDVHESGRLSWINTSLIVVAAAIAALGIIQDQLLLIVGAMALSPDYFPIADISLSMIHRSWHQALLGVRTLFISFTAGAFGAFLLTEALWALGALDSDSSPSQGLTLFISRPDVLSVVVALFAGVAGGLAITLPHTRGLVGVFVSVTTIPAAANMGVALSNADWTELLGSGVQLAVNVVSLVLAGTATLLVRRKLALATIS